MQHLGFVGLGMMGAPTLHHQMAALREQGADRVRSLLAGIVSTD